MAAPQTKRIITEITKLQNLATDNNPSSAKFLLDKSPVDTPGSNLILGRIFPRSQIYNQAAFQIEIKLPAEFPFKPPEVRFITPIYHPNVGDEGKICVEILNPSDGFKPTTTLVDIVKAVVDRIDNPSVDHALKPEIGQEYSSNRSAFDRKALEMVKKHGLPRQ
ncbi:unnamed protein product [Rotaria sordida]|uniref:UBC core domain-containing protein n=1 Tax=Rotaria sordida TaxID=392033 RepID=A0A815ESL0_9BILA|nr:unnamed protein product [Rotaria sordida]CAF1154659.1 unnamed protein product [Rotaria sordida]CAF1309151.1 unnamed protein product [Rotaria sordida]CAF1316192.1 unnamed protein product [Rotaria sordida]CAF1318428.1 unnamed protein product [Rotaria sordida]